MADAVDGLAPGLIVLFVSVLGRASDLLLNAGSQAFVLFSVSSILVNLTELGIFQTFDFVYRDCGRAGINYSFSSAPATLHWLCS